MATPTYDLIEEQVLGSAVSSVTLGSGGTIPQTYKDLVLEMHVASTVNAQDALVQFNGDTGTNYSLTRLSGDGTTASSGRRSSIPYAYLDYQVGMPTSLSSGHVAFTNIMSYANTNVYKTLLVRSGSAGAATEALVNLWRSTSAITSILIYPASGSWVSGCTFRLWGVA